MKTKLLNDLLAIGVIVFSCGNDDQPDTCVAPITISFSARTNAANAPSDMGIVTILA